VFYEQLLNYISIFSEAFTATDSDLFRRKVATCLGTMLPGDVGDAAFHPAWEEVQAFAWQKHSQSQLVPHLEGSQWLDKIAKLHQFLLNAPLNLTEAEINEIIVGLLDDPESP
jgi:hypothetical protein